MEDALVDSGLDKFNELVQLADLGEEYFSNKTVFAPSNKALGEMPPEVLEGYKTDSSGLKGRTSLRELKLNWSKQICPIL